MSRQFDDLQLGSLELFCTAAELGSFTGAATTLGITPAAVSRAVARLEERLGVRLFVRSTRRVRLSEAGEAYFLQCRQALSQLAEAERELTGQQQEPAGTLRISVPTTYGHYRILPLLPAFRERYPRVRIEAHVSNRNIDFAEEGYDLAVRARTPVDSGLVARKLEDVPLVVVASPAYLRKAGTPATIEDLARHECIQFARPSTGRNIPWQLMSTGIEREVETAGSYSCSEDVLAGITLARAGAGLFQAFRLTVEKDLADGSLVEVLQAHAGSSRRVSLLYPHGRHLPLRVRVFIDFVLDALAAVRGGAGTLSPGPDSAAPD